jgi:2-dehydro-3-deoxygluconokinase
MLYGLMTEAEPQQIIDLAIACGALKQSIAGDWALVSKAELEQFINNGPTGRIIR